MSTSSYQSTSSQSSSEGLYNREEEVGSGGIGTVYRGVQTRLARPVAIKEIRNIFHVFADVQRDDIIRRFVEIVQTQASLDHPNIIQIYDVISDADYPYVVMQYAPKGNLRNLIDTEGRPPLNVAMHIQAKPVRNDTHQGHKNTRQHAATHIRMFHVAGVSGVKSHEQIKVSKSRDEQIAR